MANVCIKGKKSRLLPLSLFSTILSIILFSELRSLFSDLLMLLTEGLPLVSQQRAFWQLTAYASLTGIVTISFRNGVLWF